MTAPRIGAAALLLAAAGAAAACGGGDPVPAVEFGAQIFADPRLAENSANDFSCATCHATTAEPDPARIYPGYSLFDSAFRASWWGGYEIEYLRAVNYCYDNFMRGREPLVPEDPKAMALYEYLASISPTRPAPAMPLTFTKYVFGMQSGDPVRGEQVYAAACAGCHGAFGSGDGRLSSAVPRMPAVIDSLAKNFPSVPPSVLVIEKVRHGKFWGIGGVSPPFSQQAMSNEDLAALIGFLGL